MKKALIAILAVIVLIIVGLFVFSSFPDVTSVQNGTPVPNFILEDLDGNTVSLSDFEGKPLVINSWAVWCPFCKKELVDFAVVKREFGDEVEIIAIDRAESLEKVRKYTDEVGVTDELVFLLDPEDSFYQSIGGFSMPETIFVGRDGNIVIHKRGPMDADEIREKIKLING